MEYCAHRAEQPSLVPSPIGELPNRHQETFVGVNGTLWWYFDLVTTKAVKTPKVSLN